MDALYQIISDNLIAMRNDLGIKKSHVTSLSQDTLNRIEKGEGSLPTLLTLKRLAEEYGCRVEDFLFDGNKMRDNQSLYNDPHLRKILLLLEKHPEAVELITKILEELDQDEILKLLLIRLVEMPPDKRLSWLQLIK